MKLIDNSLTSFRVKGKLPQWMIWTIAIVLFAISWFCVVAWARSIALRDLALDTDKWADDGILYQETDYACVPASIVMLLNDEGIETTTLETATIAGTDIFGTGPSGIRKAGNHFCYTVIHEKAGYDEVMSRELPAIILFRHEKDRHAAYIMPLPESGLLRVMDPVQGLLHFKKDGADEYFGSDRWDVHYFKSGS